MESETDMKRSFASKCGFLADGGERLLAGIRAEAQAKHKKLNGHEMAAEVRQAARREIERETDKLIARLDAPSNLY